MKINKWWKYALIAVVLLSLLIFGYCCFLWSYPPSAQAPEDKTAAPAEIRLALAHNSALFVPLYAALNEGFFTKEGLIVKLNTASSPDEALAWLLSGDCEMMLGGPETALYLAQQKNKTQLIHIALAAADTGYFVVSRNTDKPFAWQDMKGKIVIGSHPGELPGIIFNLILKENKLRPLHDVHIIHNLPTASAQAAFQSGTGHYLLAFEPLATRMEKENNCHVVSKLELSSGPLAASTFIVTSEYRRNSHDSCQGFLNAFQAGLSWTWEHTPEDIVSATQSYFPNEDTKTLLRSVSRYKNLGCWPLTALPDNTAFERLQEVMLLENELLVKINLSKSVDTTFAQKAIETRQ